MERGRKFVAARKAAIKEWLRSKGKKKLYDLSKLKAAPTDTTVSPYAAQGGATLGSRVRQYNAAERRKKELEDFRKKQARIKKLTGK